MTLCIGILVAALLTVLVVNISVSNRQYDMVGLKNEQLDLSQSNERLRQQVEHLQAPQNLAAEAARLGMVMPGNLASIDLGTGEVDGTATAASEEDKPTGQVAAPSGPAEKAAAAEPERADAAQGEATQGEAGAQAPGTDTGAATDGGPASGDDRAGDRDPAGQGEARGDAQGDQDLNGGTIPAPQFAASGD